MQDGWTLHLAMRRPSLYAETLEPPSIRYVALAFPLGMAASVELALLEGASDTGVPGTGGGGAGGGIWCMGPPLDDDADPAGFGIDGRGGRHSSSLLSGPFGLSVLSLELELGIAACIGPHSCTDRSRINIDTGVGRTGYSFCGSTRTPARVRAPIQNTPGFLLGCFSF